MLQRPLKARSTAHLLQLHPYSALRLRMFATAPTTTVPAVAPLLDAHYGLRDEIAPAGRAAIDAFKPVAEELNARLLEKCAESVRYIDETNLDHPKHPRDLIGKPPPDGVTSSFQIERAARFIVSILKFKANASGPAKRIFGSARVPGDVVDSFSMSPDSRHIVAMIKDHVFKVDVYDDDGNIAGVNEIERNNETAKIARLLYAACAKSLEVSPSPSVGLLTTASRSVWAASHSHLAALSAANAENLQIIENALFSVHLDDKSTISNHNYSHLQFLHNKTGRNRWFDKTLQLIIASSGRTGLNCQVAEVGVSPFANLAETLVASESPIKRSSTSGAPMLPEPIKLEWTVDGDVKGAIASAVKKVATEIKSTESVLALYDILGERYIKEVAKSEVDAFLQVAFQLTWWRLHKSAPTAAMVVERPETGGVVTRSIVNEHVSAFVESFDNDDVLYDDKRAHFRAAINAIEQTLAGASPVAEPAAVGHVQALYSLADDGQKRAMEDALGPGVAYARSYALDTVRVRAAAPVSADNAEVFNAATSGGFYAGFANSDAFGYGVAYSVGMDDLKVAVSCKRSSKGGPNAHRFTDGFKSVLADLLILFPKR
ncbi:Carnitine O-acetyltransferase mitochondrial, partial [Entophlyctis luteolus]